MANTGVFVPVSEVFPGVSSDFDTFRDRLARLSRTDTLFWCARFNLIISNPANTDHRGKQQYVISMCLGTEETERLNRFTQRHGSADKMVVFFRGQLLELLRWASLLCEDHPDDGDTFERPEMQRAFAEAALIASDLWAQRIYRDRMSLKDGVATARRRVLASVRQSIAETSSGMEPLLSLGRGKALIGDGLATLYPSLREEFRSKTGLSLDDYYMCLAAVMTHFMDITPENVEAKSRGIFNVNSICRDVPAIAPLVAAYLQLESQTSDELRAALHDSPQDGAPPPAYRPLRVRPILRVPDGRAIIMDPVFYAEKAAVGPLFVVSEGADRRTSAVLFGAFGRAFESYAGDLLRSMYLKPAAGLVDRLTLKPQAR
jgi:hypothetical protein